MLRGAITLSPDQMRLEMAKEQAMAQMGRKFISIMLLNPNMNRIQGAIILHATPYRDTITNLTKFHFEERGGPLLFNEGMDGGMHCNILDCEHNRKFLASQFFAGYWKIEDPAINEEIKNLANGIKSRAIIEEKVIPQEKTLSDDELEAQAAKLNAELAARKLAKTDAKMKRPIRKIIDATAEFAAKNDQPVSNETPVEETEPVNETTPAPETTPVEPAEPTKRGRRKSSLVNVE